MLEWASWGMIAYIFAFLIYVNIRYVPASHWGETLSGFFQFGRFPPGFFEAKGTALGPQLFLIAALAATAGSGGIGNLAITNWIRDKGFGMGGKVGAIPSAFGAKKIQLSHVGKVFPVTEANLSRWRTWWKYIVADPLWGERILGATASCYWWRTILGRILAGQAGRRETRHHRNCRGLK